MHGGSAPQVKEKAAQRLREGVMPMLGTLYRLANDDSVPPAVQLAAVRDWLDRSGIKEAIQVEVEVLPWEQLAHVGGIVAEIPDELLRSEGGIVDEVVEGELVPAAALPAGPTAAAEPAIPSRRRRATRLGR